MLYKYFTEKLLGLQDIEKIEEIDNSLHNCKNRESAKIAMSDWVNYALDCYRLFI